MSFLVQFKQYFERLSAGQKMMTLLVFIGVSGAVTLLSIFLKYDGYQTLYSQLSEQDASQIVETLKNENIPYRLANSGRTIKIPSKEIYNTRLKMASQGLPRGGQSGFELFDKSNMGMTDFMQQVNYQRAIQGELARTISEMESVEQAKVLITFPEESAFLEEEKTASASVMVGLRPGAVLDQKQIMGIVSLVSGAVKGLKPENVTLVDAFGNLLSKAGEESSVFSAAEGSLGLRRDVETYLENKALSLLEKVLGPGKAVIRITAVLNNQRVREQTEKFDPNGAIRSEQTSKDDSSVSLKNYEIGKTVREVVGTAGNIEKLNVSVVIDGLSKADPNDPTKFIVAPRPEEELSNYRQLVIQAVGLNEERGDQIDIKSIPFDREHKENVMKKMEEQEKSFEKLKNREKVMSLAGKGILSLGMVVMVLLFLKTMKKSVAELRPLETQGGIPSLAMASAGIAALPAPVLRNDQSTVIAAMETTSDRASAPSLPSPKEKNEDNLNAIEMEILKAAKDSPEEIAKVMKRAWIKK